MHLLRPVLLTLLLALAPTIGQDASLVAAWDAAQVTGGVISDHSGHGHDLTLVSATSAQFMGRSFLRFGRDGYAEGPPLGDGWPALTVLVVVLQERDEGAHGGIICRDQYGGSAGDVFAILTDPQGNWVGRVCTTGGQASLAAPLRSGWHQLALTYDGATARLYVNAQCVQEQPLTGALVSEPGTPLVLGAYSNRKGPYSGGVACAELHQRALAAEELSQAWERWQQEHPLAQEFSFAQASDLHVTDTRSVEIVNDAVDMINSDERVAFSLWLGDLTQSSRPDEMSLARMALNRLRRPRYTLRGNHDLKDDVYQREFGQLNYVFEFGGWKFIMLDTNPGDRTPLDATRMDWLRQVLAQTDPAQPLVLCAHHPLIPEFPFSLAGAEQVRALFAGHNLKAVLGAHFHANAEKTADGILYTLTACLSSTRTNHDGSTARGYRLFHCTADSITTEFVLVRDLKPEEVTR